MATAFERSYQQAVRDISPFVTRDLQLQMAVHDPSLHPDRYDMSAYLAASVVRYQRAHAMLAKAAARTVLDVGGFLAAFPLALARLGYDATIAESYGYYDGQLDGLTELLEREGVAVWDADFTGPLEHDRTFDTVLNMAMVEHLAGSPRVLMDNLRAATRHTLILEVPNIAYWPKRRLLLTGRSIHPDMRVLYEAGEPFLGHHHEYTRSEVELLLDWTGFTVQDVELFNYSLVVPADPVGRAKHYLQFPWAAVPSCREVILTRSTLRS